MNQPSNSSMAQSATKAKKRPSMKDVADLAGVSRTTVSFVVNKKENTSIPIETRERVWEAVDQLGYRPNAIAQGLRSQRTNTIGFISDRVMTTPFAGQMLLGAQDLAWQHNMLLLAVNTGGDQSIKKAATNMLLDRRVDGIIYASMYHREVVVPDVPKDIPFVLLDCFTNDGFYPSIVPDERLAGYEATRILIEKGHSRIAHITEDQPVPAGVGRLQGYKQALEEAGIRFDPALVAYEEEVSLAGYAHSIQLLTMPNRPTGIFCFNDRVALGAYNAARELGLSIPDDVAIVGFDNHEIIASQLHPGLTTMQLPHHEMGRWAVQKVLDLIQDPAKAHSSESLVKIRCEPVFRSSV